MTLSLLFIHLLKRARKNGRVKWNIFRNFSLNYTFGQDGCRKFLKIEDWSYLITIFCDISAIVIT